MPSGSEGFRILYLVDAAVLLEPLEPCQPVARWGAVCQLVGALIGI